MPSSYVADSTAAASSEKNGSAIDSTTRPMVASVPARKRARHQVGGVAEVLHHAAHPASGGVGDPRVVVEHPRRGAQADAGALSDVAQDALAAHPTGSPSRRVDVAAIDGTHAVMPDCAIDGKTAGVTRLSRRARRGCWLHGVPGRTPVASTSTCGTAGSATSSGGGERGDVGQLRRVAVLAPGAQPLRPPPPRPAAARPATGRRLPRAADRPRPSQARGSRRSAENGATRTTGVPARRLSSASAATVS